MVGARVVAAGALPLVEETLVGFVSHTALNPTLVAGRGTLPLIRDERGVCRPYVDKLPFRSQRPRAGGRGACGIARAADRRRLLPLGEQLAAQRGKTAGYENNAL